MVADTFSRHFICRNVDCDPKGQYVSLNTMWASTAEEGGWQFACPNCGFHYRPGNHSSKSINAHNVFYDLAAGEGETRKVFLSVWGSVAEESCIIGLQEAYAGISVEKAAEIQNMSREEVRTSMMELTSTHATPADWQRDFSITTRAIEQLEWVNSTRWKPFRWGFLEGKTWPAGFVKVTEETPMISENGIKTLCQLLFRNRV